MYFAKSRRKTIIIDSQRDDPMFCLVDHMISLALFDDAFEAESATNVRNIFNADVPEGKSSLVLKWKREALDRPVFTEPARDNEEETWSKPRPMLARTWSNYLRRLGREAGLQHSFTQYGLRRGLLNVINSKLFSWKPIWYAINASLDRAPVSIRDQLFDHKPNSGVVNYYLDPEV